MKLLSSVFKKRNKGKLPSGCLEVGSAEKDQNCFSFVLGLERAIDREEFEKVLNERGHSPVKNKISGDVIAYYKIDPDREGFNHAAKYLGEQRALSRMGMNGSLIEHPMDVLPESYFHSELGVNYLVFRKT